MVAYPRVSFNFHNAAASCNTDLFPPNHRLQNRAKIDSFPIMQPKTIFVGVQTSHPAYVISHRGSPSLVIRGEWMAEKRATTSHTGQPPGRPLSYQQDSRQRLHVEGCQDRRTHLERWLIFVRSRQGGHVLALVQLVALLFASQLRVTDVTDPVRAVAAM